MKRTSDTVANQMELRVTGTHRNGGNQIGRFVSDLLRIAQERDGVYGSENKPVSAEMEVSELLDWHADYTWKISSEQPE